ncbi:condensation domain-containing protein, partial [Paenibacillus sp. LS1]|uniref:condensation domain-containing protein n=1 Tax=Paenibacillus sp. LS1 TaxID=2992120 RepID=UPI002230D00E
CDDRQMNALAEAFMDKLMELIEHCVSRSETEHTPSDFGERTWTQKELNGVTLKIQRQGYELERIYPLTSLQEGMLYHKVSEPSSTSYVVQVVYQMEGIINIETLKESLQLLTIKHDVLRTSIVHTQVSIARQVLLKHKNVEFSYLDLRNDPESSHAWEKAKINDVERGFDLENDSLLRAVLVDYQENDTRLVLTFHHIIMDGWSMSLLVKDLLYFYTSILHGTSKEKLQQNLSVPTSYGDYVVQLEAKDQASSLSYWKELLQDYESSSDIVPEGKQDSTDKEVERIELGLSKSETIKVENLCSHLGITVNTIVEAAWGIVLQKYNNSSEAVFGKIVSGRNINLPHVEEIVGLFINMIPVHVQARAKNTMRELLLSLQQQALQSSEHDYCSLADIQNLHEQGSYLIQTMLAFENYFVQPETAAQNENFKMIEAREQTNYSLTLLAMNAETLEFALMYDTHRYSREEVSTILGRLRSALMQIVVNPEVSMDQIRLIDENEMDVILNQFNATDTVYPSDRSVVELFHSQTALTPDQLAVVSGEEQMTYRELEQRSSQLAEQLRLAGVEHGEYVGIMAERNTHTITGILAILKVGAAYMPIDPKYPDQRVAYMLKDSKAKVVLIGEQKPEALKADEVITLSMLTSEGARKEVVSP